MAELLRGRFGLLSVAAILQLVEHEELTCWLRVGDLALVGFVDGVPVYARMGALTGRHGVLGLFFLDDGASFVLDQDLRPHGEALGRVIELVLEGSRLADSWAELRGSVVQVSGDASALPASLSEVAPWLSGGRTLSDAVAMGKVAPCLVVDDVIACLEKGSLEVPSGEVAALDEDSISLSDLLPGRRDRPSILDESTVPPDLAAPRASSAQDAPSLPRQVGEIAPELRGPSEALAKELDALAREDAMLEELASLGEDDEEAWLALGAAPATDEVIAAGEDEIVGPADIRLSFGQDVDAEDPPTDIAPAEDEPSRGRQALKEALSELGPRMGDQRDAQSRAFLAWSLRRGGPKS